MVVGAEMNKDSRKEGGRVYTRHYLSLAKLGPFSGEYYRGEIT